MIWFTVACILLGYCLALHFRITAINSEHKTRMVMLAGIEDSVTVADADEKIMAYVLFCESRKMDTLFKRPY